VRLRVLELCRERLAPHGVAYISYNALPGCHISGMWRDMMRFHTQHLVAAREKIGQGKALLQLLLNSQTQDEEFAAVLKKEAGRIFTPKTGDALLFHDDLADTNQAFYFHEFAALAGRYALQFLAEAEAAETRMWRQPAAVAEALETLSGDIVLKEQYLDFLVCRRFRKTLLCRDSVQLNRDPGPQSVRQFLIASASKLRAAGNRDGGAVEEFVSPRGASVRLDHPLTRAAMLELLEAWPRALPWADLVKAARKRLGWQPSDEFDDEAARLAAFILAGYGADLVELHVAPRPAWSVRPGPRPVLSPLARWQFERGREIVTGLNHDGSRVDIPIVRELLLLLDGTRDLQAVTAELSRRIDAGELKLPPGAKREDLHADVQKAVQDAATKALLIA
jgi:methyltransferase-like protein